MFLDPTFSTAQQNFISTHCHHFTSADENKLIYTELFQQYVDLLEKMIEQKLTSAIPNFSMQEFLSMCESRGEEQIGGDVFEMLCSLGDFEVFKQMMVDAQAAKSQTTPDLGLGLSIQSIPLSPQAKAK